jgi:alanyl-tRNA synthetase
MLSAAQIRQTFLDFFASKGHIIVSSAPIVNKDDPTLLFTNAGMNQFKDIFTGNKPAPYRRVANTQKCLRVSGKHNDLEEVGHDTYHHTMFEMLGNWSFGDYFKAEAITWSWELLTEIFKIPKERLYVTVFGGDAAEKLPADEEAAAIWKTLLPEERILYFGKKDNFWEMGDTGPCGPCTEIHIDLRSESAIALEPGRELVNTGHWQVIEIWNNVFIQFDRKADGSLVTLPMQSVDTGMGFERLCMVLQGKTSTYDIDIFLKLRKFLADRYNCQYDRSEADAVAIRVILDHIRAITFCIADGQLPANTGAGYVVRRIIRRAIRYAYQYLHIKDAFLYTLVPLLAEEYGSLFIEVAQQQPFIMNVLKQEEETFLHTLERGMALFEEQFQQRKDDLPLSGEVAFRLYDTYGFPLDLTLLIARERNWSVDESGFEAAMQAQRARSRAATKIAAGDWITLQPDTQTQFLGYELTNLATEMVKFRTIETAKGAQYQVVLSRTPFYAESGGQVGDTGRLTNGTETIIVLDTQKENELIVHRVDKLPQHPEGEWQAIVDPARRKAITANHSATHLLHAALRQILGTHVEQRGSLVKAESLRFDFSHFQKVTDAELEAVESLVNTKISAAIPRQEYTHLPIETAKQMGAMALFGEKYGEFVRVIRFDETYSTELCGGCHVHNTLEIRLFKILSESAVAAGIRRIEAITAEAALEWYKKETQLLDAVRAALKNPKDVLKSIQDMQEKYKLLEDKIAGYRAQMISGLKDQLLKQIATDTKWKYLIDTVNVDSAEELKMLSFELKKASPNTVFILGTIIEEKPLLSVIMDESLGLDARQLIQSAAKAINGGGGGQAFYATAGGKNPNGLTEALALAKNWLAAAAN